jgi:hypothetical protein
MGATPWGAIQGASLPTDPYAIQRVDRLTAIRWTGGEVAQIGDVGLSLVVLLLPPEVRSIDAAHVIGALRATATQDRALTLPPGAGEVWVPPGWTLGVYCSTLLGVEFRLTASWRRYQLLPTEDGR